MNTKELIETLKKQVEFLENKQNKYKDSIGINDVQEILELSRQIEKLVKTIDDIQRKVVTC